MDKPIFNQLSAALRMYHIGNIRVIPKIEDPAEETFTTIVCKAFEKVQSPKRDQILAGK